MMFGARNKWCFVPGCRNTSIRTPNKKFVSVPRVYSRKMEWFKAVRRDFAKTNSSFFCCEDHFNFKEDMENYIKYTIMGGKILLRRDVVPHIFHCQPDRKTTGTLQNASTRTERECMWNKDVSKANELEESINLSEAEQTYLHKAEKDDVTVEDMENLNNTSTDIALKCDVHIVKKELYCEETFKANITERWAQEDMGNLNNTSTDIALKYDVNIVKKELYCEEEENVKPNIAERWPEVDVNSEDIDTNSIKNEPTQIIFIKTESDDSS